MAEGQELKTVVYCLGPVGGIHNPVITQESGFKSKEDYTKDGYDRYIREARNVIKMMHFVVNYFMESTKTDFEEDLLAFIDAETEEHQLESIQKLKKQWKVMFNEHQKKLREHFHNKNPEVPLKDQYQGDEEVSSESSGSSAKVAKSKPGDEAKAPESKPEAATSADVDVPPCLEFPQENSFFRKVKEIGSLLRAGYQELSDRMGKALNRLTYDESAIHDLKGFTLRKLEKFAKWKYALKRLDRLVPELESKFQALDLDFDMERENEKRLPEWMYFDEGERDRKYHHRILIPVELVESIEKISAIIWWQIRRWGKLANSLADRNWKEYKTFKRLERRWKHEVLYGKPFGRDDSNESNDTLYEVENMPAEP